MCLPCLAYTLIIYLNHKISTLTFGWAMIIAVTYIGGLVREEWWAHI